MLHHIVGDGTATIAGWCGPGERHRAVPSRAGWCTGTTRFGERHHTAIGSKMHRCEVVAHLVRAITQRAGAARAETTT